MPRQLTPSELTAEKTDTPAPVSPVLQALADDLARRAAELRSTPTPAAFRQLADLALVGVSLAGALEGGPVVRPSIREDARVRGAGIGGGLGPLDADVVDDLMEGVTPVSPSSGGPFGLFAALTETVGQDAIRELLALVRRFMGPSGAGVAASGDPVLAGLPVSPPPVGVRVTAEPFPPPTEGCVGHVFGPDSVCLRAGCGARVGDPTVTIACRGEPLGGYPRVPGEHVPEAL